MQNEGHQCETAGIPIQIQIEDLGRFTAQDGEGLSDGWIFIPTSRPHAVGSEVDLEFCLGTMGSRIYMGGLVTKSISDTGTTQGSSGMRVQITTLDDVGKMFIGQILQALKRGRPSDELQLSGDNSDGTEYGKNPRHDGDADDIPSDLAPKQTARSNLLAALSDEDLNKVLEDPSRYSDRLRSRAQMLLDKKREKGASQS